MTLYKNMVNYIHVHVFIKQTHVLSPFQGNVYAHTLFFLGSLYTQHCSLSHKMKLYVQK